jgi:hypothetical protein
MIGFGTMTNVGPVLAGTVGATAIPLDFSLIGIAPWAMAGAGAAALLALTVIAARIVGRRRAARRRRFLRVRPLSVAA